jgi:hypothetical protein
MRLSLRTTFWLTLVIAVLIGWCLERQDLKARIAALENEDARPSRFTSSDPSQPSKNATARRNRLATLEKLSDDQLRDAFAASQDQYRYDSGSEYELCLVEMARRRMTADLQEAYDELMSERSKIKAAPLRDNAKLLTALRRAQGHPDPLKIHAELTHSLWDGRRTTAPLLIASVENVDVDREDVYFVEGGDYGSGRKTRWRVHFCDEKGNQVPGACVRSWGTGGGLFAARPLLFGMVAYQRNRLDARQHVKPPPPGHYNLQVVHSLDAEIADDPDLTGLIVFRSQPFEVVVTPSPPGNRTFSAVPLLALLCAGWLAVFGLLLIRRKGGSADKPEQPHSTDAGSGARVTRRDLHGLTVLTLLAIAWQIDSTQLKADIRELQFDEIADWSIHLPNERI